MNRLIVSISAILAMVSCGASNGGERASMNVEKHIISLERSALDRWIRADPDGYLGLYEQSASYFDPFSAKRVDGLPELRTRFAPMRAVKLPFTEPRYDMIDPVVRVEGDISVLSFNLINYGKPLGSVEERVLARWNATEVYRKKDGEWRIIHTHWSFTQPRLAESPSP